MDKVIPKTLKRIENYQNTLYKSSVLSRFQTMTRGHLQVNILGDDQHYSFGLGQKVKAQLTIKDEQFFSKLLHYGEVGFGESYVRGEWESENVVDLLRWFLVNLDTDASYSKTPPLFVMADGLHRVKKLMNQSPYSSFDKNISFYYDLGHAFFKCFLDESLTNSSALFLDRSCTLEEAQMCKNRRIGQQLQLDHTHEVLDIGCGWGSLSLFLALTYSCRVTSVTVSEEQFRFVKDRVQELNLQHLVTPLLCDFREIKGYFDRIVSAELVDSLIQSDLTHFFKICDQRLKPGGRQVHQIILQSERTEQSLFQGEWVDKYISPGALTPTLSELCIAIEDASSFRLENLYDLGQDYARTHDMWLKKFEKNRDELGKLGYDESFLRTWRYYLAYSQAAYSLKVLTCVQISLTRPKDRLIG